MNFFIHLLPILFIIFTCADTPNKPVIRKELFGWAGAPEDINKKPHECFYAKLYGKVEILSSKLRAEDYKNKCIQSATKQAKEEMLLMALHYSFLGGNDIDGVYLDLPIFEKNMKKKIDAKLLNCKPNAYSFHQIAVSASSFPKASEGIISGSPSGYLVASVLNFSLLIENNTCFIEGLNKLAITHHYPFRRSI